MPLITLAQALRTAARSLAPPLAACLFLVPPQRVHAQAVPYALDLRHTRVHWEVMHFGTSTSRGRFDAIEGSLHLDPHTHTGEVSIAVRTDSVNTGVAPLDAVLRRSYLHSEAHPVAHFVARHWRHARGAPLEVRGELTLNGVSLPLTLRAPRLNCEPHPQLAHEVCGADLEGELRRSDFGITEGLPFIGNRVRLVIQVEAIRQP